MKSLVKRRVWLRSPLRNESNFSLLDNTTLTGAFRRRLREHMNQWCVYISRNYLSFQEKKRTIHHSNFLKKKKKNLLRCLNHAAYFLFRFIIPLISKLHSSRNNAGCCDCRTCFHPFEQMITMTPAFFLNFIYIVRDHCLDLKSLCVKVAFETKNN